MDNKKIKEKFSELLMDKKIFNLVCFVLVIAFILLTLNIITSRDKEKNKTIETNAEAMEPKESEKLTYEEAEERELLRILQSMKGVGEVEVKMYFATSEVKVPAEESNSQTSTTEESDTNGGKRVNNSKIDSSSIVMQNQEGDSSPVILQVNKPEVTGVIVVADGAADEQIKYDIQTAVSKLYNLSVANVNVFARES